MIYGHYLPILRLYRRIVLDDLSFLQIANRDTIAIGGRSRLVVVRYDCAFTHASGLCCGSQRRVVFAFNSARKRKRKKESCVSRHPVVVYVHTFLLRFRV
jgi:hypothetical protein